MSGMSGLSNRLRYIRESRGYNQTQIAHLLQTSQQTYSRYENGEHDLPSRHLFRLAEFYQVSAAYLLGGFSTVSSHTQQAIFSSSRARKMCRSRSRCSGR